MQDESILKELIGMDDQAAATLVQKSSLIPRIVYEDGEHYIVTMDIRGDRINLSLEKGKVISAYFG